MIWFFSKQYATFVAKKEGKQCVKFNFKGPGVKFWDRIRPVHKGKKGKTIACVEVAGPFKLKCKNCPKKGKEFIQQMICFKR